MASTPSSLLARFLGSEEAAQRARHEIAGRRRQDARLYRLAGMDDGKGSPLPEVPEKMEATPIREQCQGGVNVEGPEPFTDAWLEILAHAIATHQNLFRGLVQELARRPQKKKISNP